MINRLEEIGDLNKASDEDVEKAKENMDHLFLENKLNPSDEKYEYDKRVSFTDQNLESSWD